MLKVFLASLILTFSIALPVSSIASEIKCEADSNGPGIDPDYVIAQIHKVKECFQASQIVEACGAGSSMDNMTTAAAIEVCDKQTGKLSKSDASLKKLMLKRCDKECDPQNDGTLCISAQSFCHLDVSKFFNSVNSANN